MEDSYSDDFYLKREELKKSSARKIVPLIMNWINPLSVLDVGCGTGAWLSVFKEHKIEDIQGIDGAWVNKDLLHIEEERFSDMDLENPYHLGRNFDLVMSLEVAEHLPEKEAVNFVNFLTSHGRVVLFSAAIPLQGGVNHFNEQWQAYWVKLFDEAGYLVADLIRCKIWDDEEVLSFYAQNIFLFADREHLSNYPLLVRDIDKKKCMPFNVVHPRHYQFRLMKSPKRYV